MLGNGDEATVFGNTITVLSTGDDYVEVQINVSDDPTPPPTTAPNPSPTPPPTTAPNPSPTPPPTTAPNPNPTPPPTTAPNPNPTPPPTPDDDDDDDDDDVCSDDLNWTWTNNSKKQKDCKWFGKKK